MLYLTRFVPGIGERGLYRVSSSTSAVNDIKRSFNDNPEAVDLSCYADVHCITGVLKRYLRELPDPVIPINLYEKFLAAHSEYMILLFPALITYSIRGRVFTVSLVISECIDRERCDAESEC